MHVPDDRYRGVVEDMLRLEATGGRDGSGSIAATCGFERGVSAYRTACRRNRFGIASV